ncbi:MAG: hypothetical protein J7L35_01030 [Anaerolineales bacterium]|nr:hypothetical protein [Anaerolineales bacterium]
MKSPRGRVDERLRVPGLINQFMRWMGGLIPPVILSGLLGRRWRQARQNRENMIADLVSQPESISI